MTGSKIASAAAIDSQRGSKQVFGFIIPVDPVLLVPGGREKTVPEGRKSNAGSR
jgi:hypothetical protein